MSLVLPFLDFVKVSITHISIRLFPLSSSALIIVFLFSFNRLVQTMDYSVIVFDTAPTGHTLRLLQFPSILEKGLAKMMSLKNKFGGLFSQVRA